MSCSLRRAEEVKLTPDLSECEEVFGIAEGCWRGRGIHRSYRSAGVDLRRPEGQPLQRTPGGSMNRIGFSKRLTGLASLTILIAVLTLLLRVAPASAANCLKDNYGKNVQCSANDVSIASATNIRGLDGKPLTTCQLNTTFSFIADFRVVTTASARQNVGLYFQTAGGSSALTATCSATIIPPTHTSPAAPLVTLAP